MADGFDFDPDRVAYYEAAGWKAYYARDWFKAFRLFAALIQEQFQVPFPRSLLAAYYLVRASQAFAPRDNQPQVSRQYLEKFYRMAVRANGVGFDPKHVADLELRYWIVHRQLVGHPNKSEFVQTIAELHGAIFGKPVEAMWPSAESRVEAANTVDWITSQRSRDPEQDWRRVEEHLRSAYRQAKEAG